MQAAWRNEYYGLAALMAVAWDSQLSPIDNRSLTLAQVRSDNIGIYFAVDRAETGKAAAATLSQWSTSHSGGLPKRLRGRAIRTPPRCSGRAVAVPGPPANGAAITAAAAISLPGPYTKSSLNQDFSKVRELAFGKDEKRQLQDMRRSGVVEGDAGGGGSIEDQANKMANTVDRNKQLRKTYNPVNVGSVRRFDEPRARREKTGTECVRKCHSADPCDTRKSAEGRKPLR